MREFFFERRDMTRVIKEDFWYWPADRYRRLHICLPDHYDESDERYPVMYFFDGHNLFFDSDATYGKSWGLKTFLDGWNKDMIIVGMECSHEGDARLTEYCPYEKRMFGKVIHGIGDQTFSWILNDVKPEIDRRFRTWYFREATGIAGSSMGGIMAMHGVLKYNQYFSKAACLSAGVFHNLPHYRKVLGEAQLWDDTRIYMGWGEYEAGRAPHNGNPATDTREARSTRKFAQELNRKGIQTFVYFQPGGRHTEADWERQVPVFMNDLWF